MSLETPTNNEHAVLKRLAYGEYVDIPTLINEFGLEETEVLQIISDLLEKGDIKKHETEEKYGATDEGHGIWKIRSIHNTTEFGHSSARLSPETWQKTRDLIISIEKNQHNEKK